MATNFRRACGLGAIGLTLSSAPQAAAKSQWEPIPSSELGLEKPASEPDAAAEALVWKIDVDDRDYSESREVSEYVRYKIYDPAKADRIVRLSQQAYTVEGVEVRNAEMSARLTQPDGSTQEFGAESVREREVVHNTSGSDSLLQKIFNPEGFTMKEKFLAVGGAQPGAVLEFRIKVTEQYPQPATFRTLQMDGIPVRQLTYVEHPAQDTQRFAYSLFVLNSKQIEVKEDKRRHVFMVTGANLPALHPEPLAGTTAYYAITIASCYTRREYITLHGASQERHFRADQPWAPFATLNYWRSEDHVAETSTVKSLAAELIKGAGSDLEKGQRIHAYVQDLHQRYLRERKRLQMMLISPLDAVPMDDVIDFEKKHPDKLGSDDFLYLALSLYRAAGLKAELLLLPNRRRAPFNEQLVSEAFITNKCAAFQIAGDWHFSLPNWRVPLGFDQLPWELTGYRGLLARDNKQDFIEIPPPAPEQSQIQSTGKFSLSADGTLSGDAKLVFTGQEAFTLRSALHGRPPERQRSTAHRQLSRSFPGAEITVRELAHIEDCDEPVEIALTLSWRGFATRTEERLIFRPFVFRAQSNSPFSSSERRNPVFFTYAHAEADKYSIALPPEYALETKVSPPNYPGKALSYQVSLAYSAKVNSVFVTRTFTNAVYFAPLSDYPALKRWFDAVATSDQHELVLVKQKPAAKAESGAPAAAPPAPESASPSAE